MPTLTGQLKTGLAVVITMPMVAIACNTTAICTKLTGTQLPFLVVIRPGPRLVAVTVHPLPLAPALLAQVLPVPAPQVQALRAPAARVVPAVDQARVDAVPAVVVAALPL